MRTWGSSFPADGDLVELTPGKKLMIDQDTPQLAGIVTRNASIIFSNNTNITVKAGYISVIGG